MNKQQIGSFAVLHEHSYLLTAVVTYVSSASGFGSVARITFRTRTTAALRVSQTMAQQWETLQRAFTSKQWLHAEGKLTTPSVTDAPLASFVAVGKSSI